MKQQNNKLSNNHSKLKTILLSIIGIIFVLLIIHIIIPISVTGDLSYFGQRITYENGKVYFSPWACGSNQRMRCNVTDDDSYGWCSCEEPIERMHTNGLEMSDKPIIYLYPEEEIELSVKLGKPENLTASYPTYTGGWDVLARPDGTLTDLNTGRSLYSLYWEGINDSKPAMDEGFIIPGSETSTFLEEKLALLGLTEREAEEFIVYWLPKMQNNPYNLIRFETLDEINAAMPLKFSVEPNTLIRVMMDYKPLDNKIQVPEQQLPETPIRKGFTAVEWGGSEL